MPSIKDDGGDDSQHDVQCLRDPSMTELSESAEEREVVLGRKPDLRRGRFDLSISSTDHCTS